MRVWVIRLLAVALCLCLAVPVLAADQGESVWAKYNMKIWGRVKFDAQYDTSQFVKYNDFLGVPADSKKTSDFDNDSANFNPRDTRLGFAAMHAVGDWAGKGVVEIDFYGTNAGDNLIPRMRLGYADLANKASGTSVRVGQDWTPVQSLNPSTIDFGILSASGNLWWRRPQVTVRQNVDIGDAGGLQLLASAMLARRQSTSSKTRMPWALGRAAYSFDLWGGKHMLALDGGYQHDKDSNTHNTINRWLVGGEFKFNFSPLLVKGEVWTGKGIGGDFLRYDLDKYEDKADSRNVWEAWGGWIDATYKLLPQWSITAGVGIDDPDDSQYERDTGNLDRKFTRNITFYTNTWWSLAKDVKVGFEWLNLTATRKKVNRHHYDDMGNRFTLSLYYGF
ncbi:MAG: hypothetical protein JRJ12_00535 [Deltaproteobacteria bacterium]|nr:hypothetical protein [Deltaproteobacteria bacterium]MBW2069851.1 hypothetical protein [Deltaproteobacteria bacterium]